ncbi:MAG: preprotein translocase subunit SecE [Holosporales bacterium]|jgi:preprotein translocase subunit SecE|nr:preprotein translocase subunit SecE [Holosporales bacterium]
MVQKELTPKVPLFQRCKKFFSEVKKEISQVVWPTRRETSITTFVVCIFALVMALYLFLIDRSILFVIQSIMN